MSNEKVRVRFAPSPTGFLHVGGLRTALFNFLWARHNKGVFILRIEDTDQSREVEGADKNLMEILKDFKLQFDEGPVYQSDRLEIYKEHIQKLLESGAAYKCYCSEERINELKKQADLTKVPFKYDKHCLTHPGSGDRFVIRQNIPEEGITEFTDLVYGHIKIENRILDDGVLIKSDGFPTYNFANVVDDHDMQITHVIRGEEFNPSTPKHILLYQAFGWDIPQFMHLPLIVGPDRKKLSKRNSDVSVESFIEKGYLREALLNFIAFLGWNPKSEKEIFTVGEMIAEFDVSKINRSNALFDVEKLQWFNSQYLMKIPGGELLKILMPYFPEQAKDYPQEFLEKIIEIEKPRLKTLPEIGERVGYFFSQPEYASELLVWKKSSKPETVKALEASKEIVNSKLKVQMSKPEIEKIFLDEIGDGDKGTMLWPLRVALSGAEKSPGPFEILEAFLSYEQGKDIAAARIDKAIAKL